MAITILPCSTKAERERFIKSQWKFYENDPHWVPPLLLDRRKILNTAKNPFYQHAELQLFLAMRDDEIVGRIAAITNQSHNDVHNDKTGFFGFFECIDNQDAANALFDAAADWLRSKGKDVMRGPVNPSVNDEIGLLIEGFDAPAVILMTYNPRYYPLLLENYGLKKSKDLYAYLLENKKVITPKLERGAQIVRDRYNIKIRNLDFKKIKSEIAIVKDLYNRSWEKNWGAVAMTGAEFDALAADLLQVVGKFKDMIFIAERNGEPVGFALSLPDINQILIGNKKGRLIPGAIRLMTQTKKINLLRIIVLGVLPEHRGKGIDSVMYWECVTRAAKHGIFLGEASWILEDNVMMNRGAELMNATLYKKYRMYDKTL
jgi:GNAT superfamily N-acetyltransferase